MNRRTHRKEDKIHPYKNLNEHNIDVNKMLFGKTEMLRSQDRDEIEACSRNVNKMGHCSLETDTLTQDLDETETSSNLLIRELDSSCDLKVTSTHFSFSIFANCCLIIMKKM
jgi:hypothetical protein